MRGASAAFTFPSPSPLLAPRAALGPYPGHGHAQGPARSPSQGERCGFEEGPIREAWLREAEGARDPAPSPSSRGQSSEHWWAPCPEHLSPGSPARSACGRRGEAAEVQRGEVKRSPGVEGKSAGPEPGPTHRRGSGPALPPWEAPRPFHRTLRPCPSRSSLDPSSHCPLRDLFPLEPFALHLQECYSPNPAPPKSDRTQP